MPQDLLTGCVQTLVPPRQRRPGPYTDAYGYGLAAGDFNGDGFSDLVILAGSPETIVLHLGGPAGLEEVPIDGLSGAGTTIQALGDVNGDGYADVAARTPAGVPESQVVILYGNPTARLSFHVQNLGRPRYYHDFGWQMTGGDFNADGYADGAFAGWGFVDVFHGSSSGMVPATRIVTPPATAVDTSSEGDAFGAHLSAPGDIDGDGHAELAIGAPLALLDVLGEGDGRVFVYDATARGVSEVWSRVLRPFRRVGLFSVATFPGDINGDGYDDLAVGAPNDYAVIHGGAGELHIYTGSTGPWWCAPSQILRGPPVTSLGSLIW